MSRNRHEGGSFGMGGGQSICPPTYEPARRQKTDISKVISILWTENCAPEVLLFGNRLTGISRPADKAELAKNLARVCARFLNNEPTPDFAHYIVTTICKQIRWRRKPVIYAALVTALAALANTPDMRDVPRPKVLEREQEFKRKPWPPVQLARGTRSQLAKAQLKKVVLPPPKRKTA